MSDSRRVFSLLRALRERGQSVNSSTRASRDGGSQGFGSARERSPERLRPIHPNPHDSIRDGSVRDDTLRSILSFGDSEHSEDSDKTEEILRSPPSAQTRPSRADVLASLFDGLGQSRSTGPRGPEFPAVTETSSFNPTKPAAGLKGLEAMFERLSNELRDTIENMGDLAAEDRSPTKWQPLHYAAQKGSLNICRAIVEKGGDVNILDSADRTPLHYASQQGHLEVCRLLLDKGANVNSNSKGVTPLLLAGMRKNLDVLKLLLSRGAKTEDRVGDGSTPLLLFVWKGSRHKDDDLYEAAKIMLEAGSDANTSDEDGLTPLMSTALWNGIPFAKLLLTHGANPNARDRNGRSAITRAASENDPEMLRLLMDHGADVAVADNRQWTLLHLSAQHDNENTLEVVKMLLETNEIQINDREERGATPLYLAVQAGRVDVAEILLDGGADPNVVTKADVSIIERAVLKGNLPLLNLLLEHGGNINAVDKQGLSLLHQAVLGENIDVVRRVLEAGVDVELETTDGKELRALQLAVQNDNDEIAMLLLDFGAMP